MHQTDSIDLAVRPQVTDFYALVRQNISASVLNWRMANSLLLLSGDYFGFWMGS